jgi:tRNA threonylcarbamoyladenosine modification (KEOPS) complex  Pcc1 subunit
VEATYEVTKVRMPLSSLTDDTKREGVWGLIRELASLVDPARTSVDIQMLGLDITVTARAGDTRQLRAKAKTLPGVTVAVEDEDL